MLDENPDKMDVFTIGTSVNICIYDNILHKDVNTYGPYKVI
jgi:hypothetical protein